MEKRKRISIYQRDNYKCWYCGIDTIVRDRYVNSQTAALDHKTPIKRGGDNSKENLVCCCWACNSRKSDRTTEEYRIYCFYNIYPIGKTIGHLSAAIQHAPESEQQNIQQIIDRLWQVAERVTFFGEVANESN